MPGLGVIWVGRRPAGAWEELASEYFGRIARFVPIDEVRVRPVAGRGHDPDRALVAEAEAIVSHLRPGDLLVALDERGRQRSSTELAAFLADRLPTRRVVFVIGSDLGLDPTLRARAADVFALSRLTLPHSLARVVLLEQLYRACDLNAGGRYHRAGGD